MGMKIKCWILKESSMLLISTIVVTLATVFLAVTTFLYLRETKKLRILTHKAVSVDTSPKVFIKTIKGKMKPRFDANSIEINSSIIFTNCGKTETRNVRWSYVIDSEGAEKIEEAKGPYQYLFPSQTISYTIETFKFLMSQEQMEVVKKAVELDKSISIKNDLFRPVFLEINLEYEDLDGAEKKYPYSFKYIFSKNMWEPVEMNLRD